MVKTIFSENRKYLLLKHAFLNYNSYHFQYRYIKCGPILMQNNNCYLRIIKLIISFC